MSSTTVDWEAIVEENDKDRRKEKEVVYKFSNGKKCRSTDDTDSGVYEK